MTEGRGQGSVIRTPDPLAKPQVLCHTMIMKNNTAMTAATPTYTDVDGCAYEYEPKWGMTTLDWFNVAQCARKRMTDRSDNIHQWRGERRSFYTSLQMMQVDEVQFMDD